MALIGLGILIATISIFCYRNSSDPWQLLTWLRRQPAFEDAASPRNLKAQENVTRLIVEERNDSRDNKCQPTRDGDSKKALEDRKAMPPPPSFLKATHTPVSKPVSSPDTPKASAYPSVSTVPSFSLSSSPQEEEEPEPTSQFPAINSAQRASASSTRSVPPRLNPITSYQPPLRSPTGSASLMSPPLRSPLPNRNPPGRTPTAGSFPRGLAAPATGLAPPPTHNAIPTKPRKKVQLTPGHSPLDWANLTRDPTANLTGLPTNSPYLKVPPSLLKQFTGRKGKDAWTVLSGKVYNITPYAPYHPGGEPELMKCAGRDGTKLFGEVHPWVNWEGMLEGCLVGIAVSEDEFVRLQALTTKTGMAVEEKTGALDEMD